MDRFKGVFCALWTPTDDKGAILWEELERHLSFVLGTGVTGIMALGSTGEFLHLDIAARKALLQRIVRACQSRGRQVIANVSDVQIRNVVELARHAKDLGADCVAVLPPWFFPMEQRDLAEFFIEVARGSGAPLALYNFPEVTGKKIQLETIERVASKVPVAAVKQSGAEFEYHRDLLKLGQEMGFPVLTGSDTRLAEALELGCTGTVSGLANAIPEILNEIFENSGKGVASKELTARVNDLARRIAPLQFPLNVKATVEARGFASGAPKMPISGETREVYRGVVAELTDWFAKKL
jgi:4-hydroxy-tetrahydrodipicolinate synthase